MRHLACGAALLVLVVALSVSNAAQSSSSTASPPSMPASSTPIDFGRDVQPIFQQHCYDCHGPDKQMNGFRLDRRHEAMRGGTAVMIGRGSAASSRLYLRLVGNSYGRRMPLDAEPLNAADIDIIKRWINEGAEWPDAVSGDVPPAPLDPQGVAAFEALRRGDRAAFLTAIDGTSRLSSVRGPGGATPLMAAALYGDAELVRTLLDRGANPNVANDAGATPLMWAVSDLEKTRLLLDHGADVHARSNDGRVPLIIAASTRGNIDVLRLLIARGANPSVQAPAAISGSLTAVTEAAKQGDEAAIRLLIEHGSDVAKAGFPALAFAIRSGCTGCVEAIAAKLPAPLFTPAMALSAPPLGGALETSAMLGRGADPNARNPLGFPILVLAAGADTVPVDAVRALIQRGADLSAKGPNGETALMVARRHGHTPMVDLLMRSGAAEPPAPAHRLTFSPARSPAAAVARSLPLLQRADVQFLDKAGCVSCHNNTQTAHTIALARRHGFAVDETIAARQRERIAAYIDDWRERSLLGQGIPGDSASMGAALNALEAEGRRPDATTDALARFIRLQQIANGSWRPFSHRPPLETSAVKVTVESMRAVQAFAAPPERAAAEEASARAAAWLKAITPDDMQDRAFLVIGRYLTRAERQAVEAAAVQLLALQRPDGGWSQIPTLASDAYATGQAIFALLSTGARTPTDPAVRRGIAFLLKTQLADGSWFVARRAIPLQPYFDAGFPHGPDQFVSASATNWATQALILASAKRGS